MDVFTKYFARLVASSASQIFPGFNRPGGSAGSYQLLTTEMQKISHKAEQARNIAESIEIGTEEIFRDFDLSTFMEHFKLDALEKTTLALAFKLGSRSDLKTKGKNHPPLISFFYGDVQLPEDVNTNNLTPSRRHSLHKLLHVCQHPVQTRRRPCRHRPQLCLPHRRPIHPAPSSQLYLRRQVRAVLKSLPTIRGRGAGPAACSPGRPRSDACIGRPTRQLACQLHP